MEGLNTTLHKQKKDCDKCIYIYIHTCTDSTHRIRILLQYIIYIIYKCITYIDLWLMNWVKRKQNHSKKVWRKQTQTSLQLRSAGLPRRPAGQGATERHGHGSHLSSHCDFESLNVLVSSHISRCLMWRNTNRWPLTAYTCIDSASGDSKTLQAIRETWSSSEIEASLKAHCKLPKLELDMIFHQWENIVAARSGCSAWQGIKMSQYHRALEQKLISKNIKTQWATVRWLDGLKHCRK